MAILFLVFLSFTYGQSNKYHLQFLSEESNRLYHSFEECQKTDESCIPILKKLLNTAQKDKKCVPCAELELARGYYFEAVFDSGIYRAANVIKAAEKESGRLKDELQQDAYNIIAICQSQKGNTEETIKNYMKSAEIIEGLGQRDKAALIKVNIGMTYGEIGNLEKSLKMLQESYYELKSLGVAKQTEIITGNIANVFLDMGKIDSAEVWARRTVRIAKEQEAIGGQIRGYYALAVVHQEKKSDSALYYIDLSIPMARDANQLSALVSALYIKGDILSDMGRYSEGKPYYLEAVKLADEIGSEYKKVNIIRELGLNAFRNKDYKTSAENLYEYTLKNDSIMSKENRELLHEMETKFETEKKEKQIAEQTLKIQKQQSNFWLAILGGALLASILGGSFLMHRRTNQLKMEQLHQEKENAILNSFIQGEERERNRISHELHDGVAAMIGAAKMGLEAIPHLKPEKQIEQYDKVKNILEATHADVRHIAHNLLPIVLEKEGLVKAIEHFVSEINQTGLLSVTVADHNSGAEKLPEQMQLMLFRIIQELVNNIIKHSQAKTAEINFSHGNQGLVMEVSDDGIGYDGEINPHSQGLYSISQRLKSIGGNFKILNNDSRGMQAVAELKI